MKEKLKKTLKELMSYIVIIIVVILIRNFVISPVTVDGESMNPTLENNQLVLLKKFDKSNFKRFDIIVFQYRNNRLVKRIIGLPGDSVEYKNDKLYINGKLVEEKFSHKKTDDFKLSKIGYDKIPDGEYFVVGDNRIASLDSRIIGLIKEEQIKGKVDFSLLPFKKIK